MSRRWPKDWLPNPFPPMKPKGKSPVVDMAKGEDFTAVSLVNRTQSILALKESELFGIPALSMSELSAAKPLTFQDVAAMRDRLMERKRPERVTHSSYKNYQEWILRVRYKENFKFELTPDWGIQLRLAISMKCQCVDDKRPTTISGSWALPDGLSEYEFVMFVRRQIHDLELHEADEWLKYDYVNVFNPHNRSCHNDFRIEYDEHHSRGQFERSRGEREYRRHSIQKRDRFVPVIIDEMPEPTAFTRYPWEL